MGIVHKIKNEKVVILHMIFVTKDEADYLRQNIKNVKIFKTCRLKNNGSNRGKRYAEETSVVVNLLAKYRAD